MLNAFFVLVVIFAGFMILYWLLMAKDNGARGVGGFVGLFFTDESAARFSQFVAIGVIIGIFYGFYVGGSDAPRLGENIFWSVVKFVAIGAILATIVNIIYYIFRLDEEPSERVKYNADDRKKDLEKISEKNAKANSVYSNSEKTPKTWCNL
ncbi:MAG: hypothetical protein ACK5N8_04025 [Alphaproteobacteria bacterium]